MEDTRFDALLRTAAADAARDDLQTANLQRAPRRARKPLRVFIAAAACVALLATGVAAAWPQVNIWRTGSNTLSFGITNNARSASAEITKPEFGYLPAGAAVRWYEEEPGRNYNCEIQVGDTNFYLLKFSLDYAGEITSLSPEDEEWKELSAKFWDGADPTEKFLDDTTVVDSLSDISVQTLKDTPRVVFSDSNSYYIVWTSNMDDSEILKVLQNMK